MAFPMKGAAAGILPPKPKANPFGKAPGMKKKAKKAAPSGPPSDSSMISSGLTRKTPMGGGAY